MISDFVVDFQTRRIPAAYEIERMIEDLYLPDSIMALSDLEAGKDLIIVFLIAEHDIDDHLNHTLSTLLDAKKIRIGVYDGRLHGYFSMDGAPIHALVSEVCGSLSEWERKVFTEKDFREDVERIPILLRESLDLAIRKWRAETDYILSYTIWSKEEYTYNYPEFFQEMETLYCKA